jgi:hypothetical protein
MGGWVDVVASQDHHMPGCICTPGAGEERLRATLSAHGYRLADDPASPFPIMDAVVLLCMLLQPVGAC